MVYTIYKKKERHIYRWYDYGIFRETKKKTTVNVWKPDNLDYIYKKGVCM